MLVLFAYNRSISLTGYHNIKIIIFCYLDKSTVFSIMTNQFLILMLSMRHTMC